MGPDPFGDIPLFKELQRLLAGGSGPVNLEIARQVASSIAGGDQASPDKVAEKAFSNSVREAEMLLSGYSRLPLDEPARTTLLTRKEWVSETLEAWSWVFERLASRFTSVLDGPEGETPPDAAGMMGQIVPLLMGLQVGTLVGHLADDVLSRWDLPIPREDDGRLFLVESNTEEVASAYGFGRPDLVKWLALQEAGRRLVFESSSWIRGYFRSVVGELIDSVEIDVGDIERRMTEMQSQGMEGMQELVSGSGALPVVETPRHRAALERYRAFVSLFEGYATHASIAVAEEWLEAAAKVNEGMIRRAASPSEGKTALQNVLGLSFDRSMTAAGTTFCAAIAKLRGLPALNEVWIAPDNLPTPEEIRDPFAWIERVLDEPSELGAP